ncbi:MAG: recombinase family protein [Bdellovibrionota bacterium]
MFSFPYAIENTIFLELPAFKNPIVLRKKYLEKGLTVKQMSVLLGCGETSLKKYLKQFGIRKTEVQEVRHKENLKYGQRLISGKLKEHKKELSIKNAITEMYFEQELTTTAIAKILTHMKIPTKKQGKKWDHSTVRRILEREDGYREKCQQRG